MTLTNLAVQLTSFIGREREIAEVSRLLLSSHLVTITGVGGSGKTRLAIQVASTLGETFTDGIWMIDLAPLHDPELVPQLVAQVLGLHPAADQPLLEALLFFLRPKQLLLILDNCEHLSEACAALAQELLSQAPELRILATSREGLAISGEMAYPLSGLAWPDAKNEAVNTRISSATEQALMGYDAVRLFVERARASTPNFTITPENALSILAVCRRLDGLPLALELASARVNILTVQQIAARLDDRFSLLTSGKRRDHIPRHHTLRAAIDWSYDLLKSDEQALLRHMAVFEAGCTLDILEAICAGEGSSGETVLDLISSLVRKSLVVAETGGRAQVRYRLLETIREYLVEKLEQAGEAEHWRDRHLNLFLARTEEGASKLGGPYQQLWLNWLEGEYDNLRTALAWAMEGGSEGVTDHRRIEAGLRIASGLVHFWQIRGNTREGLGWLERLLAESGERISPVVRVNAIVFASFLAMFMDNGQVSLEYGREAVRIAEAAGDEGKPLLAFALAGLSSSAKAAGDYQTAFHLGERAVQMYRELGPSLYLGMALLSQGEITLQMGNHALAREWLSESLILAQNDHDTYRMAHTLNLLGNLARFEQNYADAAIKYKQSEVLLREMNAQLDLASVLNNLGFVRLYFGEVEHGKTLFQESMSIHLKLQNKQAVTENLIGLAATAVVARLPAAGARLMAALVAITGMPNPSRWLATQMEYERYLALIRANLSDIEFQIEQAIGRDMSIEQAVDFAQNLPIKAETLPGIRSQNTEPVNGLTGREREIAGLIGQGKTNSEIAGMLFLSKRTVETHASHILSKLGLSSRAQIIRWAIDHGLTEIF